MLYRFSVQSSKKKKKFLLKQPFLVDNSRDVPSSRVVNYRRYSRAIPRRKRKRCSLSYRRHNISHIYIFTHPTWSSTLSKKCRLLRLRPVLLALAVVIFHRLLFYRRGEPSTISPFPHPSQSRLTSPPPPGGGTPAA